MIVEWSRPADQDLEAYIDYLHVRSPAIAALARESIFLSVGRLSRHPLSGRAARWPGLRELPLARWRKVVVYRVEPDRVAIIALLDARRDLASLDPNA